VVAQRLLKECKVNCAVTPLFFRNRGAYRSRQQFAIAFAQSSYIHLSSNAHALQAFMQSFG
jgi:hypothetical protein